MSKALVVDRLCLGLPIAPGRPPYGSTGHLRQRPESGKKRPDGRQPGGGEGDPANQARQPQ